SVMIGKVCKGFVQRWLITVTFGYGRSKIIGDNSCRNAAVIMQRIFTGCYKVLFLLAQYRFHIGKLAGAEDSYKDLCINNLTSFLIGNAQLFTCEVYIQLVACFVIQVHGRVNPCLPLVIVKTKLGVLESVRKLF